MLVFVGILCVMMACSSEKSFNESSSTVAKENIGQELKEITLERGTRMSLEEDTIVINRNTEVVMHPIEEADTWTIFVYLCGTDLESSKEVGFASVDIQEMMNATTGENVRFVVQTGGTNLWRNAGIDASELGRYEICNGNMVKVDAQVDSSMGSVETLANFLKWGITKYPAANLGLILWNHGGGSIAGICVDEKWEYDRLYLSEIDAALAMVLKETKARFEFIGFDACLMATVECANILATYADYMYASEEIEVGYGWDYVAIGNYLGQNPGADGQELGKVVCDSFFDMLAKISATNNGTMSVTDLSKIDNVLKNYHFYAKDLNNAAKDMDAYADVVKKIHSADCFGNNSKETGYTNMVDLAGIVSAGSEYSTYALTALEAIDEAVIYVRNGELHKNACGLATYYPLAFKGKYELEIFDDITISPYYLAFVTRTAYGLEHNGDMSGYVEEEIVDVWQDVWSGEENAENVDEYWNNYENTEISDDSKLIEFELEPILSDGWQSKYVKHSGMHYGFKLTEESEKNVVGININRWRISPDGKYLIELGSQAMLDVGRKYGYGYSTPLVSADFSIGSDEENEWGDGGYYEPIATYVVEADPNKSIQHYIVPMLVNGESTYLHMIKNRGYKLDGIWDGIDADGIAGRELGKLEDTDILTPMYNAILLETGEETIYYGSPATYEKYRVGTPELHRYKNATYIKNFEIIDIFGNSYMTDFVYYTIEDEELVHYAMLE